MTKISVNAGDKYGRLTIIEEAPTERLPCGKKNNRRFVCQCECGNVIETRLTCLRSGETTSCGCARNRHGHTRKVAEHQVWIQMKGRCLNPSNKGYKNYGGRGIGICDRWKDSYENFYADMGPRPSEAHSLERIDNEQGYEPGNCRWATKKEQNRNRRSNRNITYGGQTLCFTAWVEKLGVTHQKLQTRTEKLGEEGAIAYFLDQVND